VLLMLGLSLLRTNWAAVKAYVMPPVRSVPDRVSGD
jgi:hypothetical protein